MTNVTYGKFFNAVIDEIRSENDVLPKTDKFIAERLTKVLDMSISSQMVFHVRGTADIPRHNLRAWLHRHGIDPIRVAKVQDIDGDS